jgi:hypothetical protein
MKSIIITNGKSTFSEPVPYSLAQLVQKEGFYLGNYNSGETNDLHQVVYTMLKPSKLNTFLENGLNGIAKASGKMVAHQADNAAQRYQPIVGPKTGIVLADLLKDVKLEEAVKDFTSVVFNRLAHKNMKTCATFFIDPLYGRDFAANEMLVEAYMQCDHYGEVKALVKKLNKFYSPKGYNVLLKPL